MLNAIVPGFVKKRLKLIPPTDNSRDIQHAYNNTVDTCNTLNMYYRDFLESFSILREKKDKGSAVSFDVDDSLVFMESQIMNISRAMEIMAEEMGTMVRLEDEE